MTNATMDFSGLNTQFAIEADERGALFPALQATNYKPSSLTPKIAKGMNADDLVTVDGVTYERSLMALSDESLGMLDEAQAALLNTAKVMCSFKDDGSEAPMNALPDAVRFVVLAKPKLFKLNKDTGDVSYLQRGDKLAGTKNVTIARLFLACVVNGVPIVTEDGEVQIFTLKLTSSKTELIGKGEEKGTIAGLNAALCKHFKASRQWFTHLVSVAIAPNPRRFVSKASGEASVGIMFEMVGGAQPLPVEAQQQIFDLVSTPKFKELADDPFRLKSATTPDAIAVESETEESIDVSAIPF